MNTAAQNAQYLESAVNRSMLIGLGVLREGCTVHSFCGVVICFSKLSLIWDARGVIAAPVCGVECPCELIPPKC